MSTPTTNVLASGIEIIGSIRFQNDMHIDGKITIGQMADIKGDINAGEVHVYGHVNGNVRSNRCHLSGNAAVMGDITTGELSMEQGARLSGRVEIG